MERDRDTIHMRDALELYLSKNKNLQYEVKTRQALKLWEEIVDDYVRIHTRAATVKDRKLYVHVASTVLANELQMKERELLNKINSNLKVPIIDKIVFKSGFFPREEKKEIAVKNEVRLSANVVRKIENLVKNVADEDLRKVLKNLFLSIAIRNKKEKQN